MAGTRQHYPAEFKAEAVRQVQTSKRPVAEIARDLGVNPRTLRGWVAGAERRAASTPTAAGGAGPAVMREELAELRAELEALQAEAEALRAENAELRQRADAHARRPAADAYRLRRR
ncbi:transposase [Brevibacterium sp. p3-SID960]|uniref:transposase n=1 Tax=Brevibacterium sp. p3-SID960 TaxID=2916063 RepID=UPI0021A68351|nr:transposase [Brevibacterium sp. p3-SID960]MCT1691041.1 transposase [Brevibacterium sp. p3-SID960]